jgi:hypothetical protein
VFDGHRLDVTHEDMVRGARCPVDRLSDRQGQAKHTFRDERCHRIEPALGRLADLRGGAAFHTRFASSQARSRVNVTTRSASQFAPTSHGAPSGPFEKIESSSSRSPSISISNTSLMRQ